MKIQMKVEGEWQDLGPSWTWPVAHEHTRVPIRLLDETGLAVREYHPS